MSYCTLSQFNIKYLWTKLDYCSISKVYIIRDFRKRFISSFEEIAHRIFNKIRMTINLILTTK